MIKRLKTGSKIARSFGFAWTVRRAWYEVQVRSGMQQRRFARRTWAENELSHWLMSGVPSDAQGYAAYWQQHRPPFFFQPGERSAYQPILQRVLGAAGGQLLTKNAQQIKQGHWSYFFAQQGEIGFPPDWHYNSVTGQHTSSTQHWSQIPVFSAETGDIKFIWEPGRFAAAYTLARAYWLSGDEAYVETFWQIVESWQETNPPNHGAHWRCGQETSLRLMAWCFALYAFADAAATTPPRLTMLVGMIAVQADRVAGDHIYAYLQGNNHAISEGVGLWTVGILFPELKMATKWREQGRKILESEARRQIYDDGSYVQQSINYHRLMLHDYLWAIRLGKIAGYDLSFTLHKRVQTAGEFLYQLQDETSGYAPNYGANDGALILPLSQCDYRDLRPVLSSIHYLFHENRLYEHGLWDEDLVWLFGTQTLQASQAKVGKEALSATVGGYYTLHGGDSWGMIRCAALRARPSQADMLHFDLWHNGVNVACDAGTYLYYAMPPWNNGLATTEVHNTVVVDGVDQMERGPRFLWLRWTNGQKRHFQVGNRLAIFEGEHDGYGRLSEPVTHRRSVLQAEDIWVVIDDLVGEGAHEFALHWLLADLPFTVNPDRQHIALNTGTGNYNVWLHCCLTETEQTTLDTCRSSLKTVRGWQSLYYGTRQPALSVRLTAYGQVPCRFISVFAPAQVGSSLDVTAERVVWRTPEQELRVSLLKAGGASMITKAIWENGMSSEQLSILEDIKDK